MRYFPFLIFGIILISSGGPIDAQSNLLESVKRNPKEAENLCRRFRALNKEGFKASSALAIKEVAKKRNLNKIDAEILSMYVIALNCPDVK